MFRFSAQKKPAINPKGEGTQLKVLLDRPCSRTGHSAIFGHSAMGQAQIKSALHIDRSLVISLSWNMGRKNMEGKMRKNPEIGDALMLLDVCSCTFQFESVEWFESFHFGRVSAWRMHFRMVSSMNYRHAGWSWVWPMALRGFFRIQRAVSKACHFCVDIFLQWFEPAENPRTTVVLCQVWKKSPLSSNSNSLQMRPYFRWSSFIHRMPFLCTSMARLPSRKDT